MAITIMTASKESMYMVTIRIKNLMGKKFEHSDFAPSPHCPHIIKCTGRKLAFTPPGADPSPLEADEQAPFHYTISPPCVMCNSCGCCWASFQITLDPLFVSIILNGKPKIKLLIPLTKPLQDNHGILWCNALSNLLKVSSGYLWINIYGYNATSNITASQLPVLRNTPMTMTRTHQPINIGHSIQGEWTYTRGICTDSWYL